MDNRHALEKASRVNPSGDCKYPPRSRAGSIANDRLKIAILLCISRSRNSEFVGHSARVIEANFDTDMISL